MSGSASVISLHASIPFFNGIITSMTITSGFNFIAMLTAEAPSPAWPTTSKLPARSRTSRSPSLIISWSSTTITLTCLSVAKLLASSICVIWNHAGYACAASRLARAHLDAAAHSLHVPSHVPESVAAIRVVVGETDPVVGY